MNQFLVFHTKQIIHKKFTKSCSLAFRADLIYTNIACNVFIKRIKRFIAKKLLHIYSDFILDL